MIEFMVTDVMGQECWFSGWTSARSARQQFAEKCGYPEEMPFYLEICAYRCAGRTFKCSDSCQDTAPFFDFIRKIEKRRLSDEAVLAFAECYGGDFEAINQLEFYDNADEYLSLAISSGQLKKASNGVLMERV